MALKNYVLAADTAAVAATNAAVLVLGARLVAASELTDLAMYQLLAVTAIGLQRASILTPALAAQRTEGRTFIPLTWLTLLTVPFCVVATVSMPLLIGSSATYGQLLLLGPVAVLPALVQDLLRYAAFSRGLERLSLASDLLWLVVFLSGLSALMFTMPGVDSWLVVTALWGGAGWCAAILLAIGLQRSAPTGKRATLRATLRLGRWSGADAALSGLANLLPFAVAALTLTSSSVAMYRILQTATGPLNILSATLLTSFGLQAWALSDLAAIRRLRARTMRLSLVLAGGSAIYYAAAFPILLAISGVREPDAIRVALILGVSGVVGAATIPITAAATAMGYQRVGLGVRVVVVVVAAAVSFAAASGVWLPWDDPVGVVALSSALAGLIGWGIGYQRGYQREVSTGGGSA